MKQSQVFSCQGPYIILVISISPLNSYMLEFNPKIQMPFDWLMCVVNTIYFLFSKTIFYRLFLSIDIKYHRHSQTNGSTRDYELQVNLFTNICYNIQISIFATVKERCLPISSASPYMSASYSFSFYFCSDGTPSWFS